MVKQWPDKTMDHQSMACFGQKFLCSVPSAYPTKLRKNQETHKEHMKINFSFLCFFFF